MNWIEDKEIITQKYFELINLNNIELFGIMRSNLNEVQPIQPLIHFIISRIDTIITLAIDDKIWDAEIIMRSALETFIKFIFITKADKEEQKKRIDEYWNLLAEINSIKMSEQAKKNLNHFGDSEIHKLSYLPLILPEELEKELRIKWTKSERQKIEQKWSFTEMIMSLSKLHKDKPLEMLIVLTHGYRLSSHVMHGDETGISIIEERESRTLEEQNKANRAHYIRILSDCLVYCSFVGIETASFLNLPEKANFFFKNHERSGEVENLTNKYKGKVFEDKDYDKYRTQE